MNSIKIEKITIFTAIDTSMADSADSYLIKALAPMDPDCKILDYDIEEYELVPKGVKVAGKL